MKRHICKFLLLCLLLSDCAGPAEPVPQPIETVCPSELLPLETEKQTGEPQLLAKAESEAQAQEIARLYGIALVEFRRGLAAFYTEEDPKTVIARREQGWPELYHNNLSQAF